MNVTRASDYSNPNSFIPIQKSQLLLTVYKFILNFQFPLECQMTLSKGRLSTQYHLVGIFYSIVQERPSQMTRNGSAHFLYPHRIHLLLPMLYKTQKIGISVKIFAAVALQSHIGL